MARSLAWSALGILVAAPQPAGAQHLAGPRSVTVTTPIIIPSGPAPASPYPLVIPVSGVQGARNLSVRLTGLTHTWPTDLDIMLVYPTGETVMLMSDVDAGPVTSVNLTFENGAPLPPTTLVSGTYSWSIDGREVTLRWVPPQVGPAPAAYLLSGGVQPGEVLASIPTGSAAPAFRFTAPAGSFHVRIRSLGGGLISAPSNELPIHVMAPVPPSAPAGLTAVANGSSLGLS